MSFNGPIRITNILGCNALTIVVYVFCVLAFDRNFFDFKLIFFNTHLLYECEVMKPNLS